MKVFLLFVGCLLGYYSLSAADKNYETIIENKVTGEKIRMISNIPATPVRNQYKTSTCWSFSGLSLIESELLRTGKGAFDLSEMFIVRYNYERKADRFVRMHGKANFAPGGETNDVTDVINNYGIVPEDAYTGLQIKTDQLAHTEMDKVLLKYVDALVSNTDKEISTVWKEGFDKVLDSYLGEIPDHFEYNDTTYTPEGFAEYLGIDPSDYIMITSFTHKPYYEPFILEIPDNWSWAQTYNVPLEILEEIVDSALLNGYSVAWAADVTEVGFNFKEGMALAPKILYDPDTEKERTKWLKMSEDDRAETIFDMNHPAEELTVTPEVRQTAFDNFSTTDDHGMHITGLAQDKSGRYFYYVKNSWGNENPYNGYMFISKPYFRYKTISVMLNRDALPKQVILDLSL